MKRKGDKSDVRWALSWGLLCLLIWVALAWLNQPPFVPGYQQRHDRVILAGDSSPLASLRHPNRRSLSWLATPPYLLQAAAIAAEDKRFLEHHGVDWLAVARAAKQNLMAGQVVSGASTISMQLARLEAGESGPRGYWRKLRETSRALWLEAHYSKQDILCWYLNLAPFGGPLVGVSAASHFLLGLPPERLSAAQAAVLMALPQDPARLLGSAQRPRLLARRNYILERMAAMGAINKDELTRALAEPLYLQPLPPPSVIAPHFTRALAAGLPPEAPELVPTYLLGPLQTRINHMVKNLCQRMRHLGLEQAAVVVLRNSDRAVLAWVGSSDFYDQEDGQVDGVVSPRQPGSALKPFVYALGLENGAWLSQPIDDSPLLLGTNGQAFRPRDYDGRFRGRVSLRVALASSLNVPAMRMALLLPPDSVLDMLRGLGFTLPFNAAHYGPGLALGNGEVTLLTLSNAYATMAEGGLYKPVRMWQGQEEAGPRRALGARAVALITDVLADDVSREAGFGRHGVLELPFPAAVKTGTSQHHRDNWCLGYTKDYTVGVWAGNFSGRPMQQVSGVSGAAPLWRAIMLMLHHEQPGGLPVTPPGIARIKICSVSGLAPSPQCPTLSEELAAEPLPVCPLHGVVVGAPASSGLSLDMPAPGGIYMLDPDVPLERQALHCRLQGARSGQPVVWFLDGQRLEDTAGLVLRLPLKPGLHRLRVEQGGTRLTVNYRVLEPGQAQPY